MFNTHIEIYGWLFDEDGSRIESSFKIREIEDIRLQYASIQQVKINGFKHEFEKWVYKETRIETEYVWRGSGTEA